MRRRYLARRRKPWLLATTESQAAFPRGRTAWDYYRAFAQMRDNQQQLLLIKLTIFPFEKIALCRRLPAVFVPDVHTPTTSIFPIQST